MKSTANNLRISYDEHGKPELALSLTCNRQEIMQELQECKDILAKGKLLAVEIKKQTKKRSLDANGYMWALLDKLAAEMNKDKPEKKYTKDELYLLMLERYGVFTHIVVKPSIVDRVKEEWRTVRELGEVKINGQTGIQLQCYFGSSTYDTAEMARLIDGVVSECKELDIETMTPEQISLLKQEWGK
jgi:hypothetical protein